MTKKEPEVTTYIFQNEYGVPIYSSRIAISKTTLKNYIDEFKYKYDLKKLNVSHIETFIKFLKERGIKTETHDRVVEWK